MPTVKLKDVMKRYGDYTAVKDINLDVDDGSYTTLLGPSGCGKTTILRMIAGLVKPTEGEILIDGVSILETPPYDRNMGYLFQNYALFPHMTVIENVGYGLLVRGFGREHIRTVSQDMLRFVDLLGRADFMPDELSGGMCQRVALVRALCAGCKLLLLDEPMSSLDPKEGVRLRYQLKKTAKKLGLTVIHVTHGQADAMSISDDIIVMRRGAIAQVGAPKKIYNEPATPYIAHFIGESIFMNGRSEGNDTVLVGDQKFKVNTDVSGMDDIVLAIRPEKILFSKAAENTLDGKVLDVNFIGSVTRFIVLACGIEFIVTTAKYPDINVGDDINLYLPPKDIMVFSGIQDLEKELKVL